MKDRLVDTQEDDPLYLFYKRQQFRTEIVGKVLKDLPLVSFQCFSTAEMVLIISLWLDIFRCLCPTQSFSLFSVRDRHHEILSAEPSLDFLLDHQGGLGYEEKSEEPAKPILNS